MAHPKDSIFRNQVKIEFSRLIIGKNLCPRPLWESPTPNGLPRRCMSSSSLVRAQIKRKRVFAVGHMVRDLSVSVYVTRNRLSPFLSISLSSMVIRAATPHFFACTRTIILHQGFFMAFARSCYFLHIDLGECNCFPK